MADTQASLPYLAIALLAQRLLDAARAMENGDPAPMRALAPIALSLLEPGGQPPGIPDYERIRTVEVACAAAEREKTVRTLRELVGGGEPVGEGEAVRGTFRKIEAQALQNFEHPPTALPQGVLALCQAT